MTETIISIIDFEVRKHQGIEFHKALDLFQESVENYKTAPQRKKLECGAQTFISACIVAAVEPLTGAQAFEVFNNVATDYGADKEILEKAINNLMQKERKDYEKDFYNPDTCWGARFIKRMCSRTPFK